MKLSELTNGLQGAKVAGDASRDVTGIVYHACDAYSGSCFFALKGARADGRDFAMEAIKRGAAAVVTETPFVVPQDVANVVVPDAKTAIAEMSARFYGWPSKELVLIGVTGTNGKTTTTHLIEKMFAAHGRRTGIIGTIEYKFAGKALSAPHTTPQSSDLQRLLMDMVKAGCDSCAMEVSSHGISQGRVLACHFDCAVFTNLTPEHLDYHNGMEDYFEAKAMLFEDLLAASCKKDTFAVIGIDDKYGARLVKRCKTDVLTYGLANTADARAEGLESSLSGLKIQLALPTGKIRCRSRLCGKFNAKNILAAAAVASRFGVPLETIADAVEGMGAVKGRFESVPNKRGILALVDYAHTPDALENVLISAHELSKDGSRLITVFGCGGDRDKLKRPLMGETASRLSDIAIVTSDNPRTEEPLSIIGEIVQGVRENMASLKGGRGFEIVPDRREAIERAVMLSREGDVIVIAGKGHEDYQIIGTEKLRFDDREVLEEVLKQ